MLPDVPRLAAAWQRAALACLWRSGVPACAGRIRRTPASVVLELVPRWPEHVPAALRTAPALQAALRIPRPVTVSQVGPVVLVDVPLPAVLARTLPAEAVPAARGLALPLGLDDGGVPVVLDLGASAACHVLVTGATGAGKSVMLRFMARQLATGGAPGLRLVLVDPDNATWPGVPVAVDPADVGAALAWVASVVDKRARAFGEAASPVVVMVDEAQAVLQHAACRAALELVTARGRKHGVHAIIATSDPTAGAVPRSIARNLRARVSGSVVDFHASLGAIGAVGAERIHGVGRMVVHPGGRMVTVPWVDPSDVAAAARSHVHAPWSTVLSGVPACPEHVPADAWAFIAGHVRDVGRPPGVGALAARHKVGKARAAAWRAAWDTRAGGRVSAAPVGDVDPSCIMAVPAEVVP